MTDVNFAWLLRLRTGLLAFQLGTVLVVEHVLQAALPLASLVGLLVAAGASNLGLALLVRRGVGFGERAMFCVMACDVALLTALLYLSGGPSNPFSFFYLVHLALGALLLGERATWALVALSLVGSALLFSGHRPLELPAATHDEMMSLHLRGMWVALGAAAAFIVYFLFRIRRALEAARREVEKQEQLASLATLAAGAAHELSTPLSTIKLVAGELAAQLAEGEVRKDVLLIATEVNRCRAILDRMGAELGQSAGEAFEIVAVTQLLETATRELAVQPRLEIESEAAPLRLRIPLRALGLALQGLVRNAQDASGGAPVTLGAAPGRLGSRSIVRVVVSDQGEGMSPEVLARVGEPFFTTKPPGRGLGLGVFLARSLVERIGGRLEIVSQVGTGTRVTVELACEV